MKAVAIIESRFSSKRLPGKNLRAIHGQPMLARLIGRLQQARTLAGVCVATSTEASDDPIEQAARAAGADCFRGSLEDVLDRTYHAARHTGADLVVEVTGDCPLVDPRMVDASVERYQRGDVDYLYNILDRLSFPIGFDVQVFSMPLLERAQREATESYDRNNVTPYFYRNPDKFRLLNLYAPPELNRPNYRLCVDYPEDFQLVTEVFGALGSGGAAFSARDVIALLDRRPDLVQINARVPGTLEPNTSGGKAKQEPMHV